jgi:uncharacterized protein (DUF1800 family)
MTLAPLKTVALLTSAILLLAPSADSSKPFQTKLPKDQQALHAVDRLTFGGKPADVERAKRIGVEKWIDEQLHPERLAENPALAAKLASLKAIQMPAADLFKTYPPQAVIAQIARGNMPMPEDPLLRQAIEQVVERYKVKKSEGKEAAENVKESKPTPEELRSRILTVLDPAQARTLRSGTAAEKRALLASLPESKQEQLLLALPAPARRALVPVAPTSMRRNIILLTQPQQVIAYDLNEAKLQRAIYSTRQLEELMVDFWFNHFNIYLDKGADRHLVPSYEREAIRPNALGKFSDLLHATASHPAMLFYLDNWQSVGAEPPAMGRGQRRAAAPKLKRNARGLNENYARELLELHTLGVDGGYTQKDVTEVARCLTGWSIADPRRGGSFLYNDRIHDKGAKTVLGVTIPAGGGQNDGEKVLEIVLNHPSTARFISRKLATRFVADDAPEELIARMAKSFTESHGDIRTVLRTMFLSREFLSAGAYRSKVKTPFEMVVSAARAVDANIESAASFSQRLNELGQPLYRKVEPTGYSSRNEEWINSAALLGRMNFALALAQNKLPGAQSQIASSTTREQLEAQLIPSGLSPSTREAIDNALKTDRSLDTSTTGLIAGLLLGSPEFQRR